MEMKFARVKSGEPRHHITKGKLYHVIKQKDNLFAIKNDIGRETIFTKENSVHLKGGSWEIIDNWYVTVTEDNREEVKEWFGNDNLLYNIGASYGIRNQKKDYQSDIMNLFEWTEISTEDFRKHVLKKDPMGKKHGNIRISYNEAKELYSLAQSGCKWRSEMREKWADKMLSGKPIDVNNEMIDRARMDANPDQIEVINRIFGKAKPKFEKGKAYTCPLQGGVIICTESGNEFKGYGTASTGNWFTEDGFIINSDLREATEKEWTEMLKKQLVKRYGKDWENVRIKKGADGSDKSTPHVNEGNYITKIIKDQIWNKNGCLMYQGNWAEVEKYKEGEIYFKPKDGGYNINICKNGELVDKYGNPPSDTDEFKHISELEKTLKQWFNDCK